MQLKYICILLIIIHSSLAADYVEENGVIILTDKNFDKVISSFEFILIEFYAPWCGHCKKLAPEYEKAAQKLKKDTPYIPLAKVDCTAEKETADKYDIQGFPTLKFFINGQAIEYSGGRTEEEIIQWIKKKSGPSSIEISTQEGLTKLKSDNPVTVVYFAEEQNHPSFNEFVKVSKQYDGLTFAHVINAALAKENGAELPSIVLFKNYDEGRNDYQGSFQFDHIINFIEQNQYQTIMTFDEKTAEMIFTGNKAVLFLIYSKEEQKTQNLALTALESVSAKLKGQILMCTADINDELGEKLAEYLGLTKNDLPRLLIIQVQEDNIVKYLFKGQSTGEEIISFFNDFKSDKLQPFFKSEEPPETNDGSVTIVVGKNFDEIVKDESKDVLVFFFAPWCTHCKQLMPIYDKLGEKIKTANHKILLTKFDATANEVAGISIESFPSIKFFPTNNKKSPIEYDGDRTEEALIKFLKDHATVPWVDFQASSPTVQSQQASTSQSTTTTTTTTPTTDNTQQQATKTPETNTEQTPQQTNTASSTTTEQTQTQNQASSSGSSTTTTSNTANQQDTQKKPDL